MQRILCTERQNVSLSTDEHSHRMMPYDNNVIHDEPPGRSCSNFRNNTMYHPCLLCDDPSMCPRGFGVSQMSFLVKHYSPSYILHLQTPQAEHWTSPWFMDYPDQRQVGFLWSSYENIRETIIEVEESHGSYKYQVEIIGMHNNTMHKSFHQLYFFQISYSFFTSSIHALHQPNKSSCIYLTNCSI